LDDLIKQFQLNGLSRGNINY